MAADYHFTTHWAVEAPIETIHTLLGDAEGLARWWPSVYLRVTVLEPGDSLGVGKLVDLHTKGWLPYTLRWRFRVTENTPHTGFALVAEGDFVGTGRWTFRQEGKTAHITYDWAISAEKPLLRKLSGLLRPLFSWNHHWAMNQGLKSLNKELEHLKLSAAA